MRRIKVAVIAAVVGLALAGCGSADSTGLTLTGAGGVEAGLLSPAHNRKMLHAEAVLGTDNGTRTVVLQRGAVTAIGAASITVKSSDGFTQEYRLTEATKVRSGREKVDLGAVTNGADIGIAGDKAADGVTAVLILVPKKK